MPTLLEALERYLQSHSMVRVYRINLTTSFRSFLEFMGDNVALDQVTPDDVNRFLSAVARLRKAPYTIRNHRTCILSVLRFAGWTDAKCNKVRKVLVPIPRRIAR